MTFLESLKKNSVKATQETKPNPVQSDKSVAGKPVEILENQHPNSVDESRQNICKSCGDSEWWIDVHGGGPHCPTCKPATAKGFIKWRFFFDERGQKWNVTHDARFEVWTKELVKKP